MAIISRINRGFIDLLEKLLFLVEFFLAVRIVLKFLAANPVTLVVKVLYQITDILIWPFNFIFPNFYLAGHLIDVVAVSAMIGYVIVFFVIRWVLRLIFKE